jgi:beta-glucuronidase
MAPRPPERILHGAGAPAGRHGAPDELFTEEHMAAVYEAQLATVAEIADIRVFCPWILYDFRSERRQNSHQRGFNRKGLIAEDKATRKLAFEVLRRFYRRRREG